MSKTRRFRFLGCQVEWSLGFGFAFSCDTRPLEHPGGEITFQWRLFCPRVFVTAPMPRWMRRRGTDDRSTGISIHGGCLWWEFRKDPWCWSSSDPWYRSGCVDPKRLLLGGARCETVKGETVDALVPMPEGCYPAKITKETRTWKRPRWPWSRTRTDYRIDIEGGIPHMGKGENSWDCGEDGLWGTGGTSPENAIANAVESVLRSRNRHGVGPTAKAKGVQYA